MRAVDQQTPIVAIATAAGRGAVGIVRASGPSLSGLARAICGRDLVPRQAHYGPFLDAEGRAIDRGIALFFPAPHSYTGEDVLELQAHGGPVLLELLLARCLQLGGAQSIRLAQPGEFTLRAFLNGKLDLAQAEAVADLIDASTELAARSAARSLEGALSQPARALAQALIELRVLVEAALDFPEEDIEFVEQAQVRRRVRDAATRVDALRGLANQGALLREGLRVVLAGQPNVGKSSLLNALAGAELAIVTPIPGTTRDRVSETIQIQGIPLHVTDTAGLREDASDPVERIGVQRSWQAIEAADVVVFLRDASRLGEVAYAEADRRVEETLPPQGRVLQVFNKSDIAGAWVPPPGALLISARTGQGLAALRAELLQRAGWQPAGEGLFIARARHVEALLQASVHLQGALRQLDASIPALDLLAEELRLAHQALSALTGEFGVEDLLGEVFGRFCIGK